MVISGWKLETSTAYEGKKRLLGTVQLLGFSGFVQVIEVVRLVRNCTNMVLVWGEKERTKTDT